MTNDTRAADIAKLAASLKRVEARPSFLFAILAGFGTWTLVGVGGHLLADWTGASDRTREVFNDVALFAALMSVWVIRYEPLAQLAPAVRAHLERQP
jgi:hypothetical protein